MLILERQTLETQKAAGLSELVEIGRKLELHLEKEHVGASVPLTTCHRCMSLRVSIQNYRRGIEEIDGQLSHLDHDE